jgi:hypothetical protein
MVHSRWRIHPAIDAASTWVVAHTARLWGAAVFAVVLALSWHTLRGIHTHQVRGILGTLASGPLVIAALATALNIAIMGLYDVIAFAETRTRALQRWKFGAVAFCWSNFLTLGPLAGPAVRFWLYRRSVTDLSELHAGIVSVIIAFVSGLAGWTAAALIVPRIGGGIWLLAGTALALVIVAAWCGRAIARRTDKFGGPLEGPRRTLEMALVGWPRSSSLPVCNQLAERRRSWGWCPDSSRARSSVWRASYRAVSAAAMPSGSRAFRSTRT